LEDNNNDNDNKAQDRHHVVYSCFKVTFAYVDIDGDRAMIGSTDELVQQQGI
jgi:hypothetical protein